MVYVHNNFIAYENFFRIYLQLILQVNLTLNFYLQLQFLPSTPLVVILGNVP